MNRSCQFGIRLVMAITVLSTAALAQNFSIDWFNISGGGGTSTNSQYVLSGTIGQADAGTTMTNAQYSLTGGFWTVAVVQTPGAPLLSARQIGGNFVLSWPSSASGFVLQSTPNLLSPSWANYAGQTNDNGTNKTVTVHPTGGNLYFRLLQ